MKPGATKPGGPSLFAVNAQTPLAERLRPKTLAEVVGQSHLLAPDQPIGRMVARRSLSSMILWGPPGCGKTTIARLLADATDLVFEPLSAVFSGVADLRRCFEAARERRAVGRGTLLFVDEIHRFNRAQQDGFLPVVEDGTVVLIGATTENPSFELNGALLSRCPVFVLKRLDTEAGEGLMLRAEATMGRSLPLTESARETLVALADGDGRYLLTLSETLLSLDPNKILDPAGLTAAVQKRAPAYDKDGDGHYNLISALHKSLRGSDADAALYWFQRMVQGGEDLHYVARRLVRFAVEDIGLADPQALSQAMLAWQAYERLGSPEGDLAIAQSVLYLATAPKSNAAYKAFKTAARSAKETGSLSPPMHILNAPTKLMGDLGYGAGYAYDHDSADGFSGQNYFPDGMPRQSYYQPVERGFEREIAKRLEWWAKKRAERAGEKS
jgi:putative ATPase